MTPQAVTTWTFTGPDGVTQVPLLVESAGEALTFTCESGESMTFVPSDDD
jgi:hypothetical protein